MSITDEYAKMLKAQCKRDSKVQDTYEKRYNQVHEILDSTKLSSEEKYVSLVAIGYGKQRAQQLVWGGRHDFSRAK